MTSATASLNTVPPAVNRRQSLRKAGQVVPSVQALFPVVSETTMNEKDKLWLVELLARSEHGEEISENDNLLFGEMYERLTETAIFSILSTYRKISNNENSLRQVRKNLGLYRPSRPTRSRPHRPQRKRGYTDKGNLPDFQQSVLRKIASEDCIHKEVVAEIIPSIYGILLRYQEKLLTSWGDYVILSELGKLIDYLHEEGLLSVQARSEIEQLQDFVAEQSNRKG